MGLTEAQLDQIAGVLFLLKSPAPSPLPTPANTDDTTNPANLAAKMQPISTDPQFKDFGIGVVDFTASLTTPKVWQYNADKSWRIASTGKLAILLAAVQLRDDVRKVKATGVISTSADFDTVFATIWTRSKNAGIKKIAGTDNAPRISTIFDLSKIPPNFIGADVPLDKQKMSDIGDTELKWADVPDFTFWELLNLTGTQSDDVAATACVSEIGVAYMKAVQRAYGLFAPSNGMHMLLAAGYSGLDKTAKVSRAAGAPTYRPLTRTESNPVIDTFFEPPGLIPSRSSTQPGSAAALTAYILALMQDKLVDKDGCDTIRTHLADETGLKSSGATTTTSLILQGVDPISHVTNAHTKLGILNPTKKQAAKGQISIRAEFAYLEAGGHKLAVVAAGIQPKTIGGTRVREFDLGRALGAAVFNAL